MKTEPTAPLPRREAILALLSSRSRALRAAVTFDGSARVALLRSLEVEARVENLFDKQVIAALASDGTRERALPRTIWVGLRIR